MSKPAAIRGTFADFRIVKTRKLAQLVIELPIEQADAALIALGGLPRSDTERWVAVARLDMRAFDSQGNLPPEPPKERRSFCELPFPQQAALKSNDLKFQLFMNTLPVGKESEDAASAIRTFCGVESRTNILPGTRAGDRWIELLRAFEESQNGYR